MKKQYNVSAELFCTTWQKLESAHEVAEKLKMPLGVVCARASYYRKRGIKLKRMPRGNEQLNIDKINKMIEDIAPKKKKPPQKSE